MTYGMCVYCLGKAARARWELEHAVCVFAEGKYGQTGADD